MKMPSTTRELAGNKIALVIVIIAFASMPLLKLNSIYNAPEGYIFSPSTDEQTAIAAGNSYLWGYANPYGTLDINAFSVPLIAGSNYIDILFSALFQALPLDEFLIFYVVTALFSALLFIAAYGIIYHYLKSNLHRTAALLFFLVVSGGIGGVLYIILTSLSVLPSEQALHFIGSGGLNNVFFQYRTASIALGLLAVLAFLKRRDSFYVYVTLGLSIIIYPIYGIPFASFFVLHFLLGRQWKPAAETALMTAAFLLPWAVFYLNPYFTAHGFYRGFVTQPDFVNPLVFLAWGIFLLPLAAYFYHTYRKERGVEETRFLLLWTLLVVALTVFPPVLPLHSQRFLGIVWLPLAITAASGFFTLLRNQVRLKQVIAIILMVAITLPSLGLFFLPQPDPSLRSFVKSSHVDAMLFLRQEPEGMLLTEPHTGLRVPYFARKRSLVTPIDFLNYGVENAYDDVASPSASEEERLELLNKYSVSYLMLVDNVSFSVAGFSKIYAKDGVTVLRRSG